MKKKISLLFLLAINVITFVSCRNTDEEYVKVNKTTLIASQVNEIIGSYERTLPVISNGGLTRYPVYGTVLEDATTEEKQRILDENDSLVASDATYDSMDANGNLYLNGNPTGAKLYKHSASAGMYYGDVSDHEKAVIEKVRVKSRPSGNYITGLYAPAGEVIKIEISEGDLEKTGGIEIHIGQVAQNGNINNIWIDKDFNRMPVIANKMTASNTVTYVGNYFGGPIYIGSPMNGNTCDYTVTISGGVPYNHYIKGVTDKETFINNLSSTAPYFDLEIWDDGIRHSGPNKYVSELDYEDICESAELWEKIASVSNQLPTASDENIGITFLYDPFICAGQATAIVGRNWTNLPPEWMYESIHYDSFVDQGAWGTIHEYNHHFQKFGFVPGDEVTNNAVSLIAYSLFTNISANRTETASDLSGWNIYTDPSRSLEETLKSSMSDAPNSSLSSYADILHSFGVDKFIEAIKYSAGKGGVDEWYKALSITMKHDMTYYFEDILHQDVSDEALTEVQALGYEMFVPVASLYQTGRGYLDTNGNILSSNTVRPYEIEYGKDYILNLDEYIIVPSNATYAIKEVTSPKYGTIAKADNGVNNYIYTPNIENELSGEFYVKLSVSIPDVIQDEEVILVINLKQKNKGITIKEYHYDEKTMYRNIIVAEANNFNGFSSEASYYINDKNFVQEKNNTISIIEGKIYIPKDGTYRIYIKGNDYTLLYSALNSNEYKLSCYTNGNNVSFDNDNKKSYVDYTCKKGDYIYFKEILLNGSNKGSIDLGWATVNGDSVSNISSIPNTYVIHQDLSFDKQKFYSDAVYKKQYQTGTITTGTTSGSLVNSVGFTPLNEESGLQAIYDNDSETKAINVGSEEFEFTVDLGYLKKIDYITIHGEDNDMGITPNTFRLYAGSTLEELSLVGYFNNMDVLNNCVTAKFDVMEIRYYKLVFNTNEACVISAIELGMVLDDSTKLSLDNDNVKLYGSFEQSYSSLSTFGHSYKTKNGSLEFTFTGSQFGLYINNCDAKLSIKIDGGKKKEISIGSSEDLAYLAYISDKLSIGEHTVEISVTKGTIDLESIVIR